MVLNTLAIDLALLLLYLCARYMLGRKKALFILLAAFLTAPFLLYVPVFYTDTLTLPFPIAAALLWVYARDYWRQGRYRKTFVLVCVLSGLIAVGAALKISVVIAWIAIMADLFIGLRGRRRWLLAAAGAGILLVLMLLSQFCISRAPILPAYNANNGIPFTHWIMMGLHGNGGYYDPDYQMTLAVAGKQARYAFTIEEIGRRLEEMGPIGLLRHLINKLAYTLGDGTYWAAAKLDRSALQPSFLHNFVIYSGQQFPAFAYATFALKGGMLAWMSASSALAARHRQNRMGFVRLACFGLIVFLLLWETRSRYLVHFLPLFLLCAFEGVPTRLHWHKRKALQQKDA